jgi:separase
VRICVELAQEHVKMGKLKLAGSLYGMAMGQVQRGQVTEEVRVTFLLRHAETLALSDNLLEASVPPRCCCASG